MTTASGTIHRSQPTSSKTSTSIVSSPEGCTSSTNCQASNRYYGWHENSSSSPTSTTNIITDAPRASITNTRKTYLANTQAVARRNSFLPSKVISGEKREFFLSDQSKLFKSDSIDFYKNFPDPNRLSICPNSIVKRSISGDFSNSSLPRGNMAMLFPWTHYFANHRHPNIDPISTTISPEDIDEENLIWPYPNFKNTSAHYYEFGSGEQIETDNETILELPLDWSGYELNFWMHGIVMPIIAVFGVLANLASFVVLTRRGMRSAVINTYLAALSLFDGFLLLIALLLYPPMSYCEYNGSDATSNWCRYFFHSSLITYPLSLIAQSGSVWTLCAITVDRYIAITWPLASRKWCTNRRALIVCAIIFVWSIIYNIPAFLELKLIDYSPSNLDQSMTFMTLLDRTDLRKNSNYVLAYRGYCYLVFMLLLPAGMMIGLNAYVTVSVRRASRIRRQAMNVTQNSNRDDKERRCTLMAVLVVSTFLIFNFLAFVNNMLEGFQSEDELTTRTFLTFVCIGNVLVALNSATNFFIYCALGLRFRQMFCKLFCPWCYTAEREYQYLSVYYGSGRNYCWTNGGGNNVPGGPESASSALLGGGIISMRTLSSTRPLSTGGKQQNMKSNISAPAFGGRSTNQRNLATQTPNVMAARISGPVAANEMRRYQNQQPSVRFDLSPRMQRNI